MLFRVIKTLADWRFTLEQELPQDYTCAQPAVRNHYNSEECHEQLEKDC